MTEAQEILLSVLRLSTGGPISGFPLRDEYGWADVFQCAVMHGIPSVVWDGLQRLYDEGVFQGKEIPQELLDEWTSWIMSTEQDWRIMRAQARRLAGFYAGYGIPMMVLKGYGTSLDWPVPEHRIFGDLDIWLFGRGSEADKILRRVKKVEINNSHHHHSVFFLKDRMVENHYDFVNTAAHYSNWRYEKMLKSMATLENAVPCDNFYIPGPDLEAMFNLRHMALHFASAGCTLRYLLDWGFMAKKHSAEIDWDKLIEAARESGMERFLAALNTICVRHLGFDAGLFPSMDAEEELAGRILEDMLNPEFNQSASGRFFPDLLFKFRRWKAGRWKHKVVFKESLVLTFIMQVVAHLRKPASLRER